MPLETDNNDNTDGKLKTFAHLIVTNLTQL